MTSIKGTLFQLESGFVKAICNNLNTCRPDSNCDHKYHDEKNPCSNPCQTKCCECSISNSVTVQPTNSWFGQCSFCNCWTKWVDCAGCEDSTKCNLCHKCSTCGPEYCSVPEPCDNGCCLPNCGPCSKKSKCNKCVGRCVCVSKCGILGGEYVGTHPNEQGCSDTKIVKKKKDCGDCNKCTYKRPKGSKKCVCPRPEFRYSDVIEEHKSVEYCLQRLICQLTATVGEGDVIIAENGWSYLLLLSLKGVHCDPVIECVLQQLCQCPGADISYEVKFKIIMLLLSSVDLNRDVLFLLTLIVSYTCADPLPLPLCSQSQIAGAPPQVVTAFNSCTVSPNCCASTIENTNCNVCSASNCKDDCCTNAYVFPVTGVLPTTYLLQEIRRDTVFNLLLIALLFLLQLRKCKTICLQKFCVKEAFAPGEIPQTLCFPLNVESYVMNDASYEFYKSVRATYARVKTCCTPVRNCLPAVLPDITLTDDQQACLHKINNGPLCPENMFYILLCHCDEYKKCIRELMSGCRPGCKEKCGTGYDQSLLQWKSYNANPFGDTYSR